MPWAATSAWKVGDEYDQMRGCNNSVNGTLNRSAFEAHCGGDFADSGWKSKGRGTWHRCAKACGSKIGYQPDRSGHPCDGASYIKGIPIKISMHADHSGVRSSFKGDAEGAFFCQYPDTPQAMQAASGRLQNNIATADNKTMYNQLIYGTNIGNRYTSTGYCENVNNLPHVVHKDGRTCLEMIRDGVSASAAEIKGRKFCESNRTDPKCRCINVADPGFLNTCKQNPTWAGCKEINTAVDEFKKAGLQSATGLFGNADCLVPQICHGSNLYQPESKPGSCANKMAICNQVMALDNIQAAAGVKAVQGCNINFEAEQKKKDDAKKAAAAAAARPSPSPAAAAARPSPSPAAAAARPSPSPTASTPSPSPAGTSSPSPVAVPGVGKMGEKTGLSTNQLAIGGGGAILLCCCCVIILILAMSGGGNGGGSRRFRR